jgi:hypothetical protein
MTIHVGWPQGVLLALMVLSQIVVTTKHGQDHTPYNAWIELWFNFVIFVIVAWGGFFK